MILKNQAERTIQWLAQKDFTCFIPERINVFLNESWTVIESVCYLAI